MSDSGIEFGFISAIKEDPGIGPAKQFQPDAEDIQSECVDTFQPFRIDGDLGVAGEVLVQGVDQFMGRCTVKIALQLYPNQAIAFFCGQNPEIFCHGSFSG